MRQSQVVPNLLRHRVRASEHLSRDPFNVLERSYGLADVVERGGGILDTEDFGPPDGRGADPDCTSCVEIKIRAPHAIEATLPP